jgi:hypothetical protein
MSAESMGNNTACEMKYPSDYMKHQKGSRNLAADVESIIKNLKKEKNFGVWKVTCFLLDREN